MNLRRKFTTSVGLAVFLLGYAATAASAHETRGSDFGGLQGSVSVHPNKKKEPPPPPPPPPVTDRDSGRHINRPFRLPR